MAECLAAVHKLYPQSPEFKRRREKAVSEYLWGLGASKRSINVPLETSHGDWRDTAFATREHRLFPRGARLVPTTHGSSGL